jgi:hypothetical protein
MECVHLKEQPEPHRTFHTNCISLYSEIPPEQVIFKLYLARVQIVSASVPEVTSMQVFECIGEEWKSPLQISLLEVCLPRGVRVVREVDFARLSPRVKRAQSDWQATVTLGCPR